MRIRRGLLGGFHRQRHLGQHTRTLGIQRIKGTGTHQRFDRAAIHHTTIYAMTEIKNILEGPT